MKEMKLIIENFRKNMKEGWPGATQPGVPWSGKLQKDWSGQIQQARKSKENAARARQIAVDNVKQEILTPYGGEFEHVQDVIDDESVELDIGELKVRLNRAFGDAYAKLSGGPAVEASEEDYLSMIAAMDVFEDDEDDVLATTDQISPPGFMPGEGGDY